MNNVEQPTENKEGISFQKGITQLNTLNNSMINDIYTNIGNIDNRNIVFKTGKLFKMLQTLLEGIVAQVITFMSESHSHSMAVGQVLGDLNAKMIEMENKMNNMTEQFIPVVKERQRLDARLKENSSSMYSGGNKNRTQRRRNVDKKHK